MLIHTISFVCECVWEKFLPNTANIEVLSKVKYFFVTDVGIAITGLRVSCKYSGATFKEYNDSPHL